MTKMKWQNDAWLYGSDHVIIQASMPHENEEGLVEHSIMDFADGTRESIISFNRIADGKIIYSETGATPVDKA